MLSTNALHVHSGYGIQSRLLAHRLRAAGHEVAVAAFYGLRGAILDIDGFRHYPAGRLEYNADVIEDHCAHYGADVLITICDLIHQDPAATARLRARGMQVLHWIPVDCEPLSILDDANLRAGGGTPVAMSRFGERVLREAGHDPLYIPHCVDTSVFAPADDAERAARRADTGLAGKFVVAMNAMNKDSVRKGFFEAYEGFAAFARRCPDSVLLLHSEMASSSFDHGEAVALAGIGSRVMMMGGQHGEQPDYVIKTGGFTSADMAAWYGRADVYLCTSWGEAFCVPLVEAQACGVPVIGTNCSAVTEHARGGWLVDSEPKYNPVHKRRWRAPVIRAVTAALLRAHAAWSGPAYGRRRQQARAYAAGYDADAVFAQHWVPALAMLEAGRFRIDDKTST